MLTKPSEKCLGERKKKGALNIFDAFLYPPAGCEKKQFVWPIEMGKVKVSFKKSRDQKGTTSTRDRLFA